MNKIKQLDVVILGGGLAGIYTALNINKKLRCGLFLKEGMISGSSILAQGGIAAEIKYDKSLFKQHVLDTLKAGSHHNNIEAVNVLVSEAKDNIKRLIDLGVKFDIDENNEILLAMEGGHNSRRILHAGGDQTGSCVMQELRASLAKCENITIYENYMAVEIIHHDNVAQGIIALNHNNEVIYVLANKVVIATGGIGGIYKNSTNDKISNGDGIALALRAGVDVSNMEFIQFHPTSLYEEDKAGQKFLISEAVRGEGARLLNIEHEPFMHKYTSDLELAPRDIVSQSIYKEMFDTWSDHVYLDITFKSREYLENRFPSIFKKLLDLGYDMSKDYIPVAPCEHFICGGITTDLFAKTSMQNLYAVGECANSGVHGANRLASNSLLECLVFGYRAAKDISKDLDAFSKFDIELPDIKSVTKQFNFKSIRQEVREVMDKYASIVRTKEGLEISKKILKRHYDNLKKINVLSRYYYDTLNMVTVALVIVEHAINRKESLGSHYRVN